MSESFTVAEKHASKVKSLASVNYRPPSIVMLTVGEEVGMWVEMWAGAGLGQIVQRLQ
jgi:hypothetical protein